ncbi:MAG: hypothetical protein CM1200mP10_28560 [Candidatus Neomarinimicrobiota bacterium]|nr:MAG: hypothetical protein CM1200mP10_28560 [Candidatus Neomarinimicrobiota bacterium]
MVDEGIDEGIDDLAEVWFDGIDNDGDGEIDELDELGTSWTDVLAVGTWVWFWRI